MLYPAFGIAGLLAAVATHGALVEAAKSAEKNKLREAADKVLDPYRDVLKNFSNQELMTRGMRGLGGGNEKMAPEIATAGTGWTVNSSPIFWLSQDQSALILENTIEIFSTSAPGQIQYVNTVKVVSSARLETDLVQVWTAEDGKKLKQESVDMFAHSLKIVLEEVGKPPGASNEAQKTFRYSEGKSQKIERAQWVADLCERAVVRTLRGWLLSIPQRAAPAEQAAVQCNALGQSAP